MSNQIKRPYPDNWPWGTPHKHPEGDTPPPFEGFNPEYPEEGSAVSNLAYSIREAKRALNSVVSVPAVFACDVEDGDIVIPLPCKDDCDENCDELLKTLRDLGHIPDAIWVPAFRKTMDSQISTLSSVDVTTYDPPFYGVAYKDVSRVMVGPVVVHRRFKFHTGDKIYAADNGDLTTTPNDHMVGVCLAPGSVYLNQHASSLKEALLDLYDNAVTDTITKVEQEGLDGDKIGVTTGGSPTERPLEVRFGDWVNVKDFGAKGDGVTNDTAAFNAAIARAQELGSNVCLFIPVGDYLVQTLPNVPCYGPGSVKFGSYTYSPFELLFKINGAIQRDTNGRFKIDFTKMSKADLAALIKQLLPTTGGGLTTDENGKLVLDLSLMTEEQIRQLIQDMLPETGGGLTTDEDGKLVVDFSQMPKEELEELIQSLLPTTGGNLETDEDGKLVVKVEELIQEGGGLSVDDDGKIWVDFDSMPTDKFEAMLKSIRVPIWLTANKNFYVNQATGSDTLDAGRGESAEKAFKTIQACVNYITDNYNVSSYYAIVNVATGYNKAEDILILKNFSRTSGGIRIQSSSGNKADVKIAGAELRYNGLYILDNLTVELPDYADANSTVFGVYVTNGQIDLYDVNIDITKVNTSRNLTVIGAESTGIIRIYATNSASDPSGIYITGPVIESGNLQVFSAWAGGSIQFTADITVVGDMSITNFAYAYNLGIIRRTSSVFVNPGRAPVITASGTITGRRYQVNTNGIVDSNSGGTEFFPGDTAGTTATGGQYN